MRIIYVSTSILAASESMEMRVERVVCFADVSLRLSWVVKAADLLLPGRVVTDVGGIKETCPYLAFLR